MAARFWVPHIGIFNAPEAPPSYLVWMRVPRELNHGYQYVVLSSSTLDRRVAQGWLADIQKKAGRYLLEMERRILR